MDTDDLPRMRVLESRRWRVMSVALSIAVFVLLIQMSALYLRLNNSEEDAKTCRRDLHEQRETRILRDLELQSARAISLTNEISWAKTRSSFLGQQMIHVEVNSRCGDRSLRTPLDIEVVGR